MMIEDDTYLMLAIAYVLNNPVVANLTENFVSYEWPSAGSYFSKRKEGAVKRAFLEEVFESKSNFEDFVRGSVSVKKLPTVRTKLGTMVGGEEFVPFASMKSDRRSGRESLEYRREEDWKLEPVEKVMMEFEGAIGVKVDEVDTRTLAGKRWRTQLLGRLKERAGLTYREIASWIFSAI